MKLAIIKEFIRLLELDVVKIATQFKAVADNRDRAEEEVEDVIARYCT